MIKSYVKRSGHFTDAQKNSYNSLSSEFLVPVSQEHINYENIFGNTNKVVLEIGFGSGLATASIAQNNPDINYIGIEVHRPGIGRLLWEIDNRKLFNIRIFDR